ncbi:MAG: RluA family pseudouridine synthase [Bacteriovoracaceae bacterium]|jgi:23S rRNA pseudouridine1911/1915/1917 synthase|nr:RluA family pseudouridine synthase [Bacteriovoracaceae bacterium]
MDNQISIEVTQEDIDHFTRLDAFLSKKLPDISRSNIKKLFESGHFNSDIKIELKKMPKSPTIVTFTKPELKETDLEAQDIALEVLFEDEHLIIINKQAGLVVHPAPGNPDGTLVNAILYKCPDLKGIGNEKRPGIVHRLDKGTTGIMVVAKSQKCHEGLVKLFSTHDIKRQYEAIIIGNKVESSGTINKPIGRSPHNRLKMSTLAKQAKNSITHYKIQTFFKSFSHVELTLETGRTHQIRVHLSEVLGTPILNDKTYGREKEEKQKLPSAGKSLLKDYEYPFLHAKVLGFKHPITNEELYFEKEPPQIFKDILDILQKEEL